MIEVKVVVAHPEGLHARPAAQFVETAGRYSSDIWVVHDGQEANAKSILAVLALGVDQGEEVVLRAEGEDAEQAIQALTALLAQEGGGV